MTMFCVVFAAWTKDLIAIVCRVASSLNIAHIERVTADKLDWFWSVERWIRIFMIFRLRLSLNSFKFHWFKIYSSTKCLNTWKINTKFQSVLFRFKVKLKFYLLRFEIEMNKIKKVKKKLKSFNVFLIFLCFLVPSN